MLPSCPGCSDGPGAEINSSLAQLPLSSSVGTQSRTLLHNQTSQKQEQCPQQFLWYPVSSETYGPVMPGAWIRVTFIPLPLGKNARGQERALKTGEPQRKVRCPLVQRKSRDTPKKSRAKNIKKRAEVLTRCRRTGATAMHLQLVLTRTDRKTGICVGRVEKDVLFPSSLYFPPTPVLSLAKIN